MKHGIVISIAVILSVAGYIGIDYFLFNSGMPEEESADSPVDRAGPDVREQKAAAAERASASSVQEYSPVQESRRSGRGNSRPEHTGKKNEQENKDITRITQAEKQRQEPDVAGDPSLMELPVDKQREIINREFTPSEKHAALIPELTETDKKLFRTVDREGRRSLRIEVAGTSRGYPLTIMGPIVINTKPNHPVYLRAIDHGQFCNGKPEIYVRTGKDGTARVDFRMGIDPGEYRILATVAGMGTTKISYRCEREKNAAEKNM